MRGLRPAVLAVPGWVALSACAATPKAPARPAVAKRAAAPPPAPPPGDAVAGKAKAEAERCFECHGVDGQGNSPNGKFARLAGQSSEYLTKQIEDFRAGTRKSDAMTLVARVVDDADLRDITAYFAALPPMRGDGGGASEAAQRLYTQGDAARGIVACASCHGSAGQPTAGPLQPRLAGQEYRYLAQQLLDWRHKQRRNSPDQLMNQIAAKLSDAEVDALSLYLSGLAP